MRIINESKLDQVIRRYKNKVDTSIVDYPLAFCLAQKTLKDAILVAAKATDENGKTHFHQRRIGRTPLANFAEKLVSFESDIAEASDFDSLYVIVKKASTEGINDLTVYDTTFRIGQYRNLDPDKIYLHGATRQGAENLLGDLGSRVFIERNELPALFQDETLLPSDVADILCNYKEELLRV
ncbi:MAG: hypothetical protein ACOVOW_15200 [Spirosomataceae bacterium]